MECTRRAVLFAAVGATVSASGCASFGRTTGEQPPVLRSVTIFNRGGEPRTVTAEITMGGETAYEETVTLEAAEGNEVGGVTIRPPEYPDSSAEWGVRVTPRYDADDVSVALDEYKNQRHCHDVYVGIHSDGALMGAVGTNQCE